jgi:hypothetical protein
MVLLGRTILAVSQMDGVPSNPSLVKAIERRKTAFCPPLLQM